jgi:hypothetical protein
MIDAREYNDSRRFWRSRYENLVNQPLRFFASNLIGCQAFGGTAGSPAPGARRGQRWTTHRGECRLECGSK